MPKKPYALSGLSRRDFLTTTAASIGSAAIPYSGAVAQEAARWRRINLSDPSTPQAKRDQVLASYKKAIRAMLALPPDNALNWYRNALVHTLDCPHGNWWFFVWHRGYLGWFERKCRELSGDPEFALPYWDWTATLTDKGVPCVPDYMFDDVLNPNNTEFVNAGGIGNHDDFKNKFKDAVRRLDYWDVNLKDGSFNPKYFQLLARGYRFPDDLWFDIIESPAGQFFFDQPNTRGPTKEKPELSDPPSQKGATQKAVSLPTILNALAPRDFITFISPKASAGHSVQNVGFGVLEGQPHNLVHNSVGFPQGFMGNFLSPVDPIFFLHHANLDRLWDVWTRKQAAHNNPSQYPILPDGYLNPPTDSDCDDPHFSPKTDYDVWACEPFLFFVDEKGNPVNKTKAGDYARIGDFNYDYQPGTGEEVVPASAIAAAPAMAEVQRFSAQIATPSLTATQPASGTITIPPALLQGGAQGAPKLFAKITVAFPPIGHAPLNVLINAPPGATDVGPSSPFFAGALEMFGTHILHAPVTFTLPLSTTLNTLRANKQLDVNRPLEIRVLPSAAPHAAMARTVVRRAEVVSIVVEAH